MNHSFVNWKIYFSNKDKNILIRINIYKVNKVNILFVNLFSSYLNLFI